MIGVGMAAMIGGSRLLSIVALAFKSSGVVLNPIVIDPCNSAILNSIHLRRNLSHVTPDMKALSQGKTAEHCVFS